ncbi:glycosyltransferase [Dolichospermum sp. UHCC 0259]|uniref:glycosyltransferase n=1 Tax=Dolichospermum sp. UHCC 0259 TaxID=2590010 RepID=UPI0014488170|nr:glycosyltransferase [Dolichospermum sp. UHCC 0259]MTJ46685.1 glycosyltransferase [Dolichospermum sp. UHCC 0259]
MNNLKYQDLYNEDYYLKMVPGLPYDRTANDGHWLRFFNSVAERLITYVSPKSVLDVGCAKGFLLEAFYNRGTLIHGFDCSEYAISCLREDLKPFVFVSSATNLDAFQRNQENYDLITCIEVVEHMPRDEALCAIKNMCQYANAIFFSSTSDDFAEPTHLTVLPRINWLNVFLSYGFVPDYKFYISDLIPHGILLRRIESDRQEINKLIEFNEWNIDNTKYHIEIIDKLRLEQINLSSQLIDLQVELKHSQYQFLQTQVELEEFRNLVAWMETSKFWKLRLTCLNFKEFILNLPLITLCNNSITKFRQKRCSLFVKRIFNVVKNVVKHKLMGFRTNIDFADTLIAKILQSLADSPEYGQWIKLYKVTKEELEQQKIDALRFNYKPSLSVILPVYKLPLSILKETINSVLQQTYTNWELCIAFADINNSQNINYLQKLSLQDNRVKLNIMPENKGISGNSNVSLKMASGEFIVLLDHDDLLSPSAFYEVINELNKQPDIDFIYSDKDCVSENSMVRSRLLLKPQWSPEILYSANYLTHLCIARRDLVEKIGGFRPETDGAQDWDLFFRITEQTSRIARIHSVLYHWRIIQGSTSLGIDSKPYALQAQLQSIQDHLIRMQLPATVSPHPESGFQLEWTTPPSRVSIVIDGDVPWDSLSTCISAVSEFADAKLHKAIVVLPQSAYNTYQNELEILSKKIHIPINFLPIPEEKSKLTTLAEAAKQNIADVVLFVSGQVVKFNKGWIKELSGWVINHPDIGFASALVLTDKNIVVEAGLVVDKLDNGYPLLRENNLYSWEIFGGALWYRNCSASSLWAVAFSYEHYLNLGGLSSDYPSVHHSIIKLCQASRWTNKRGLVNPHARAFLAYLPTNDFSEFHESLADDPYFHPAFGSVVPLKLRLKT